MKLSVNISVAPFVAGVLLLCATIGCSTQEDAFLNRNFHALTARYNILYNGDEALKEGREGLVANYVDDFWEVLPVERMEVVEEQSLGGGAQNPNFEKAEEKAVKAVQKHGMNIRGRERNPQMDEAYLLLGISRYYDQRFIPAMESFNYLLDRYPDSKRYAETRIWREKTNIRLESEELAIENLKDLMYNLELEDQDYADASAAMAQAYINLERRDSAVQRLKIATELTRKQEEKGRYQFIVGQLYDMGGAIDSANSAYDHVIALNRRVPRAYRIQAFIRKMRNIPAETEEDIALRRSFLDKMEKNRENRPYLDVIYHYIADFHYGNDSISLAEEYLNKSLRANTNDQKLKAICYEQLAEINFDQHNYKDAGAYYDSTLTQLTQDLRKIRTITRKRENLEDVIKYEDVVYVNDSILHLAGLPEEERVAYFEKYIADLKAEEEKKKEAEAAAAAESGVFDPFSTTTSGMQGVGEGKFYFYNTIALGQGESSFRRTWGSRELADNWRWSRQQVSQREEVAKRDEEELLVTPEQRYDINFYLDRLPTEPQVLDSVKKDRDFANYQLGLIYKEKFKEYPLAAEKLERVLQSSPEEKLILPSKYHLYRLYELLGDTRMSGLKEDIVSNHKGSRYAEILNNPEAVLTGDSDDPETYFTALHHKFQQQRYEEVLQDTEKYIKAHSGEEIIPKMEMLRAASLGRLYGLERFRSELSTIALDYPNDEIGKEAQKRMEEISTLQKDSLGEGAGRWKLVFPMERVKPVELNELAETIDFFSLKYPYYKNLVISRDIYDENTVLLVVHGLRNRKDALAYQELIDTDDQCEIKEEHFLVLSPDYRDIQVNKKLDDFVKGEIIINTETINP
ncbi:type IX secretion system periplasmic lipoprotein PorW/SprE [Sinomicrobium sp.]